MLIVLGNSVGDNDGDVAFLAETVLLVVPLLIIGGKLLGTTSANVFAELAAAPAHLEEPLWRCRYARAPHAEVELLRQVLEAGFNTANFLFAFPIVQLDMAFEAESSCELTRAVAAREAAPATAELLGEGLLGDGDRARHPQRLRAFTIGRHRVANVGLLAGSLLV